MSSCSFCPENPALVSGSCCCKCPAWWEPLCEALAASARLQWDFPKNKASHWEICPYSGVASGCPWSQRGFFPENMPLGIRLSKEVEIFSLNLYRGWKGWAPPPAQCLLVEGKQKHAPQSLLLIPKDSHHQNCCWGLYMSSWPSPRLLLITVNKAELRAQGGMCHGKRGIRGEDKRLMG